MTTVIALLVLAAIAGAVLGTTLLPGWAIALSALVGLAAGLVVTRQNQQRLDTLWDRVTTRLGDPPAARTVTWERLADAVDRLHREHDETLASRDGAPLALEVVQSLIEPALLLSADDTLVAANEAAREVLGDAPVGARAIQVLGSSAFAGAVAEARRLGRPVHVDAEVRDRELSAVVTMVDDQVLVILSDRTRERQIETLRRDFVVNASHELKTPVTSILTLTEALEVVMRRPDPGNRASDLARRLGEEAERMSLLVHDLLDLRRLEERGPVEVVPVDVADAARAVVDELREAADEQGVTVTVESEGPSVVAAEVDDIHLMLRNLVRNAIQYNRPGGTVHVQVTALGSNVEVRVQDTGIGMAQQDIPRIFERFYRVDAARSREAGGTGLGLSLVRHAVERHGGTVQVDSLLGQGTTFNVQLPVAPT